MTTIQEEFLKLKKSHQRLQFMFIFALVLFLIVITATKPWQKHLENPEFSSLTAERINIKEPDGTLRLTISNKALFPGAFIKNQEVHHPRDMAGFLFFNDEGTEQGGLIYKGRLESNNLPSSGLSLTFDRYQQDQQMQLLGVDEQGTHFAGLSFNDVVSGLERPVFSQEDQIAHEAGERAITRRVFLGKTAQQNSTLQLLDAAGNVRMALQVTPEGEAKIVFLKSNGEVSKEISAEEL